jgi:hypothetical protein
MTPRHLKASILSFLTLFAALLVSSCASSERMNRISWDADSYSAPKSSRISGGKFDDAVATLRTPVGLKDRQVNIWPFCTVNSRYVSILWPFIDWDDFGMAVRPFYNQEGNDRSILFPLSSWNTVDGDGWALNTYWNEDCFGIFPLMHYGKDPGDFWFAGPLFGTGGHVGFVPICYFGEELQFVGPVWWLRDDDTSRQTLSGDDPEVEVTDEKKTSYFGFFPLFWKLGGGSALLPLYVYNRNDFFFSPVFWMNTGFGDQSDKWVDGQYLFLGYWRNEWERHGFFPFYNVDKRDEHFNNVLLWWWDHNTQDRGLFPFAWFDKDGGLILPLGKWKNRSATGMDGEEETWTEGNILLLGYWGKHAWGVFPFFRGSSAESDMKYIGPLWWAYDEDEREYGLFPFFRVERNQGETNRSYLFPVYSWEKDRFGSEFTSIPYFREDYEYPAHRATTSVHGRRYLIYATHEKKGNNFNGAFERGDYIPRWGYSPSYLADVRSRMKEDDLTSEEAVREVTDEVASTWESRTTALHPFFEWTSSTEGERDLRLLFYLFGFDRDKDSSSNWLLWHILFTSGSEKSKDSYGSPRTSSYTNVLGVFPYWFRDTETAGSDAYYSGGPHHYVEECIEHLLRRALMEDGSEESILWSQDLYTEYVGKRYLPGMKTVPLPETADDPVRTSTGEVAKSVTVIKPAGIRQIIPGIPNEDVFRVCGMDRALAGGMTAQEAEDTAKHLMDAELKMHGRNGTDIQTRYGFFPLFGVDKTVREKDGETTPVSTEILTPLTYTNIEEDESTTKVLLGILGESSSETYYRHANGHAGTDDSFSTLGLIRTSTGCRPRTIEMETLNKFAELLRNPPEDGSLVNAAFWNLQVTAACNDTLKKYARFKDIVSAVTAYRDGARSAADTQAMIGSIVRWENDYFWEGDEISSASGFYPFVFWDKDCIDRNGELSNISKSWFVLPLLSGGTSSDEGSSLGILCPLLYFGATQQHDEVIPEPYRILSANANSLQASHSGFPVRGSTGRYALFMVNTSDETFLQWKPGTTEEISGIYYGLYNLYHTSNISKFTAAELKQMTVAEVLALPEDKNVPELKQYKRILNNVINLMNKAGMKPFDRNAPLIETAGNRLRELAAEHLVTRTVSGFSTGWGLTSSSFECKETGDYQTKVLFGLGANSQKLGEKEHRSILGYLYNMDTDGVNTRKFIFPFITTKDAPGFHEWSFLGGLFERSVEDGKTGGRIFFFPYGNRPGK